MPDNHVIVDEIDVTPVVTPVGNAEDIVNKLKQVIAVLKTVTKFTPPEADDKFVAFAEKIVLFVEPYAKEPWVDQVLAFAISFIKKTQPKLAADLGL